MSKRPDKCPRCGAAAYASMPFDYPSNRIHFRCDSFGYGEDIFGLVNRSDLCCEREERIEAERQRNEALERCNNLHRRLTKAEGIISQSGIVDGRPTKGGGSLGRALANYAAEQHKRDADKYRRAVELIAEDCESWLKSESDEPSVEFIKLVAKYAREALQ